MRAIALVFLIVASAVPVSAQTAIQAHVEGQVSGVSLAETQGPADTGALLADLTWGPGQGFNGPDEPAHAYAAVDVDGLSAVEVDAYPTLANQDTQTAETRWTRSVTNQSPGTAEFIYRFSVAPPYLALRKAGGTAGPAATVSYLITISLNGQIIFSSGATLSGPPTAPVLQETGIDFGGTPFSIPSLGIYGFQFSRHDNVLSLGFHPPGGSFRVDTVLRVTSNIPAFGAGARGTIGDPLDMGGLPGLASEIEQTDVVGVEATGWSAVKSLYR